MRVPWISGERTVNGGLHLAFMISVAIALVGSLVGFALGSPVQSAVSLALLGLAVLLWRRRRWETPESSSGIALAATVLALNTFPALGPSSLLLMLVTQIVVAFDLGFIIGAAVSVCFGVVFGLSSVLLYDPPLVNVVAENLGVVVLLLMTAGLGALMRVSERARSQAASLGADLAQANDALRRSMASERDLVLAQERARSARELHDGMGYRLTLVAMSLEYALKAPARHAEAAWAEVSTAASTTRTALAEMRLWVRALDPPSADAELSGAAAFEAIADAFRGTGLDVRVTHRGEDRLLGHDAALFATRFIQEGLTNVLRHAGAGRVDIDVIQSPQQLRLSIGDDGSGAQSTREGFGRRSLQERANELSGSVCTGRSALGGFELVAVVPLAQQN